MSPALVETAKAFLAAGGPAAPARPAATVVLLRQGAVGPEAYLLRRHLGMAFAAGMYAFPGGTVDPRDSDRAVAWCGPTPEKWAHRLVADEAQARALVCAAVRETFEESGVLLAGPTADTVVGDTTGKRWERDRAALVDKSLAFADFLEQRQLVLRTDLLAAWGHWITPEFEPRRYDTRFFVAVLPEAQRTRDVSGEADHVVWMRPADALAGVEQGSMAMLPPTYITLKQVSTFAHPAEAVTAAGQRDIVRVLPGFDVTDGEGFFTLPAGVGP